MDGLAMGCIPSKQSVLQGDAPHHNKRAKRPKNHGPASPIVEGEPAPWVKGHAVYSFSERKMLDPRPEPELNEKGS